MVVGGATSLRYYVTDHLGSVAIVLDGLGAVAERRGFDAWGKSRNANGADDPAGSIDLGHAAPTRGFTGHEHMPSVGLVNMNARVYDPELGRFLSADSVTENIYFSQVLNRYSYVGNNPLSHTDPTGHSWLSKLFRKIPILRSIFAIAVAITLHQFAIFGAASDIIGGFISGGISGGTLKSALMGGLQAFAFNGIHGLNIGDVGRALLHGAVGGLASIAQGGSFGSGFISAGFSELVSGYIECVCSDAVNAIRHAIAGGVTSVLAGGKFANGAITAAFGYLYNRTAHQEESGAGCFTLDDGSGMCDSVSDTLDKIHEDLPADGRKSVKQGGREYGGRIYRKTGTVTTNGKARRVSGYWYTMDAQCGSTACVIDPDLAPRGTVMFWHSHPSEYAEFSRSVGDGLYAKDDGDIAAVFAMRRHGFPLAVISGVTGDVDIAYPDEVRDCGQYLAWKRDC